MKHITTKRKFGLVFSIINKEIISHIRSLKIFIVRNFIPGSGLLYRYFMNTIYIVPLKTNNKTAIIKQSKKFILQK